MATVKASRETPEETQTELQRHAFKVAKIFSLIHPETSCLQIDSAASRTLSLIQLAENAPNSGPFQTQLSQSRVK